MRVTKKGNALIKDRERLSTPRAEFLLKFASMSDEQFEKWSELKTSAEEKAFMSAIPMPQIKTNEVFIKLEKQEGQEKVKMALDTGTLIAIMIALAGSCTMMVICIRRIGDLERQNRFLRNQLKTKAGK